MQAAFKKKEEKHTELTAECREAGWAAVTYSVEVSNKVIVGTSTQHFLRSGGVA